VLVMAILHEVSPSGSAATLCIFTVAIVARGRNLLIHNC
jgi:hypothetical protein